MRSLPAGPLVAPSLLAADAGRLAAEVLDVVDAGARVIHVDVMDGHFVPALGFGPNTVSALRDTLAGREVLLDVHLMVDRPQRHAAAFARAGADLITVHVEASSPVRYALDAIQDSGCLAGLAIRPDTPPSVLAPVADELDLALCMTVYPGSGGQRFIATSPTRIAELSGILNSATPIAVDGGIDRFTAPLCARSGAQLLVAGSAIFAGHDPGEAFRGLTHAVTRELV